MTAASILIVEDEKILAEDLKEMLQGMGYGVCGCVSTGVEAIDRVEKEKVDLVLMDIKLEGKMDGIETAQRLKNHYGMPVIYLTAFSDDAYLQRAKQTEPFGYIVKPYRSSEIKSTIEVALVKAQFEKRLTIANAELEQKVKERTIQLEEMNTALQVVMEYREDEKKKVVHSFAQNLNTLVLPHLDTIQMKCPTPDLKELVAIVKTNLEKITQPFNRMIADKLDLTPMELRVVNLIRQGRGSKEIAYLLGITTRGVTFHRQNIRKKMGIHNKKGSLKFALNEVE